MGNTEKKVLELENHLVKLQNLHHLQQQNSTLNQQDNSALELQKPLKHS